MRLRQVACIAFSLSFGATFLAERATSVAYGQSFFGFDFSPARAYSTSAPWSYTTLRVAKHSHFKIAQWRLQKKIHHHFARRAPLNPVVQNITTPNEWPLLAKRLSAMRKADSSPGALAAFLNDTTLRRKDAVMTNAGIFVYMGGASDYHSAQDFASLARSKGLQHYAELTAIEKVSIPHFEVALAETPSRLTFADVSPSAKTFEAVETKSVRHIAGVSD